MLPEEDRTPLEEVAFAVDSVEMDAMVASFIHRWGVDGHTAIVVSSMAYSMSAIAAEDGEPAYDATEPPCDCDDVAEPQPGPARRSDRRRRPYDTPLDGLDGWTP